MLLMAVLGDHVVRDDNPSKLSRAACFKHAAFCFSCKEKCNREKTGRTE